MQPIRGNQWTEKPDPKIMLPFGCKWCGATEMVEYCGYCGVCLAHLDYDGKTDAEIDEEEAEREEEEQ